MSPFVFASYGSVLCEEGKKTTAEGYQFAQLALNLLEANPSPMIMAKTLFYCHLFITHWRDPLRHTLQPMLEAYQLGLSVGDLDTAAASAQVYCAHGYFCGLPLNDLVLEMTNYSRVMEQLNQKHSLDSHKIYHQTVVNLLGEVGNPSELSGDIYYPKNNSIENMFDFEYSLHQLILYFIFNDYSKAAILGKKAKENLSKISGLLYRPLVHFYYALTQTQLYFNSGQKIAELIFMEIKESQEKLCQWGSDAPMNYLHKYQLIMAELSRMEGKKSEAIELYDHAISGAKENEYIQEEALANELAAKFYLSWDKEKIAQEYLINAYYCYVRWGAKAKVQDLEYRYPKLLAPVLEQQRIALPALETMHSTMSVASLHSAETQVFTESTSILGTLDLVTVLKASQTLSSEIQLDKLLATLLQIVMENAGADKGALLMPRDSQWFVEAVATIDQLAQVKPTAFEQSEDIPCALINTVKRNLESVVIIDATVHETLATDAYILQRQPKSVLCTPILQQGRLVAVLYLENQVTAGAFTDDRLKLLNVFCTQAAISLENARLFQQLEQSQLQIVQSEKMSALGGLVAGVAHEINNPVGCILGNVGATQEYISDLLDLLDLYAEELPNPSDELKDELEAVDLEYVREDLPKLIRAMKDSGDRIKSISKSLRTFSRADTDKKQSFDIHEGIESTVLILRHRLKANEQRPAIKIVTEYGKIPAIQCFPGQLNQVFMNILANAIDMFDDIGKKSSFTELEAHPQTITIQTKQPDNNAIEITIQDNGQGMTEDIQSRIFDHLFTTKDVGKGTGLGLTIARQIVIKKHGGSLDVQSKLGQGTEFKISIPVIPQ
jgi:signal transduction histidine kinase